MATTEEVSEAYIRAWNAVDDAERRRLLDVCWADDVILTGPNYEVAGRGQWMYIWAEPWCGILARES